eukprot:GEZU01025272.1.p2 GENE.GEZU01025272.1~~GEZU01025272.1.p2  ORF type:complete len:134 (+),score=32.64 GEZU01025272.1:144-545(+)
MWWRADDISLMNAGVPSVNTLFSEYMNLERPIMMGALKEIERRVGHDKFPLIEQTNYSGHHQMVIAPSFPNVIKVSHAHCGMGKIRCPTSDTFRDVATVVALHHDYASAEPYIDADYGLRVQKIGDQYRVFKK